MTAGYYLTPKTDLGVFTGRDIPGFLRPVQSPLQRGLGNLFSGDDAMNKMLNMGGAMVGGWLTTLVNNMAAANGYQMMPLGLDRPMSAHRATEELLGRQKGYRQEISQQLIEANKKQIMQLITPLIAASNKSLTEQEAINEASVYASDAALLQGFGRDFGVDVFEKLDLGPNSGRIAMADSLFDAGLHFRGNDGFQGLRAEEVVSAVNHLANISAGTVSSLSGKHGIEFTRGFSSREVGEMVSGLSDRGGLRFNMDSDLSLDAQVESQVENMIDLMDSLKKFVGDPDAGVGLLMKKIDETFGTAAFSRISSTSMSEYFRNASTVGSMMGYTQEQTEMILHNTKTMLMQRSGVQSKEAAALLAPQAMLRGMAGREMGMRQDPLSPGEVDLTRLNPDEQAQAWATAYGNAHTSGGSDAIAALRYIKDQAGSQFNQASPVGAAITRVENGTARLEDIKLLVSARNGELTDEQMGMSGMRTLLNDVLSDDRQMETLRLRYDTASEIDVLQGAEFREGLRDKLRNVSYEDGASDGIFGGLGTGEESIRRREELASVVEAAAMSSNQPAERSRNISKAVNEYYQREGLNRTITEGQAELSMRRVYATYANGEFEFNAAQSRYNDEAQASVATKLADASVNTWFNEKVDSTGMTSGRGSAAAIVGKVISTLTGNGGNLEDGIIRALGGQSLEDMHALGLNEERLNEIGVEMQNMRELTAQLSDAKRETRTPTSERKIASITESIEQSRNKIMLGGGHDLAKLIGTTEDQRAAEEATEGMRELSENWRDKVADVRNGISNRWDEQSARRFEVRRAREEISEKRETYVNQMNRIHGSGTDAANKAIAEYDDDMKKALDHLNDQVKDGGDAFFKSITNLADLLDRFTEKAHGKTEADNPDTALNRAKRLDIEIRGAEQQTENKFKIANRHRQDVYDASIKHSNGEITDAEFKKVISRAHQSEEDAVAQQVRVLSFEDEVDKIYNEAGLYVHDGEIYKSRSDYDNAKAGNSQRARMLERNAAAVTAAHDRGDVAKYSPSTPAQRTTVLQKDNTGLGVGEAQMEVVASRRPQLTAIDPSLMGQ